jgi:hypothetical protein
LCEAIDPENEKRLFPSVGKQPQRGRGIDVKTEELVQRCEELVNELKEAVEREGLGLIEVEKGFWASSTASDP